MSKYSILNITKNKYVKQDSENAPIELVSEKERTIFYEEHEAETLQMELDDSQDDCYTVIKE